MSFMNKKMEQMISKDLGIEIKKIREKTWGELDKFPRKGIEKSFRPKHMFIVGGNINLAENREMGKISLELRNIYRKVMYQFKCLLKNMKNV